MTKRPEPDLSITVIRSWDDLERATAHLSAWYFIWPFIRGVAFVIAFAVAMGCASMWLSGLSR